MKRLNWFNRLCSAIFCVLFFLLIGCSVVSAKITETAKSPGSAEESQNLNLDSLREYLKGLADRGETPGIGLLLARKDRILFSEAYGIADINTKIKFQKDTIVYLASTTKPISATALMILLDEGRISLDDPVSKYLPEFDQLLYETGKQAPPPIIRQLLSHTSGWPGLREGSTNGATALRDMNLTLKESVEIISREKLLAEPGARFSYGGISFNVAGRIVEVVSGLPFDVFIKERLFDPLGMVDTTFRPTLDQAKRVTCIFKPSPWGGRMGQYCFKPYRVRNLFKIGGGLYSTAKDMAAFLLMHQNGGIFGSKRILSAEAVAEMQKHQIGVAELGRVPRIEMRSYGLGWIREKLNAQGAALLVSHMGAYGTIAWVDKQRDLIGILLTPMSVGEFQEFHQKIRARVGEYFPVVSPK